MVGLELLGDQVRELELVALVLADPVETDAEGREPALSVLREQGDDQTRVETPRQEDPDRNVRHHAALHGDAQRIAHRLGPIFGLPAGEARVTRVVRPPIALGDAPPVGRDDHYRRRRQLAHALQDRARGRHRRVPGQVVVQRNRVELGVHTSAR